MPSGSRRTMSAVLACVLSSSCAASRTASVATRSEEHTSELQSRLHLVCRLLLEKKNQTVTGALVMPDCPASFWLLEVGHPKAGETVVVSAASGAVGSVLGPIGEINGCRAVAIAG